jgi:tungstate transport system substrate-binding protein
MLVAAYRRARLVPLLASLALLLIAGACDDAKQAVVGGGDELILATTTSTNDSGLLDVLVPAFEEDNDYNVKIIPVGSGEALAMGERGDADVLLVHSPSAEEEFVAAGHGVDRRLVMHNDFIIAGPADDPAGAGDAADALAALQAIADAGSSFISRGDDSGTHKLELSLWEALDVDPAGESWYQESGQGMGATLQIANQGNAYTISDRATYLAQQGNLDLDVVLEGDARLLNIYHVMQVNPDNFDDLNVEGAEAFVEFMVSDEGQELIGEFGVNEFGEQLFVPDAGKSEEELTQ